MKSFIYTLSKRTSTGTVSATIYRIKRNLPEYLGKSTWNTAAYAGEATEVARFLVDNKHIVHRNHYSRPDTYWLVQV